MQCAFQYVTFIFPNSIFLSGGHPRGGEQDRVLQAGEPHHLRLGDPREAHHRRYVTCKITLKLAPPTPLRPQPAVTRGV